MANIDSGDRPNPDLLLKSIQRNEKRQGKGRLVVYLGMAAGVGKTYAMLSAAKELVSRNVDVVAGYVETHGRKETVALLENLVIIPRLTITYRNVSIEEMDLDEILKRHPEVVLVDEAAHTNTVGRRHAKRWQDILEILDAGIDVYTTLNVQHLESLADTVFQITGIPVRETIPDSIIDIADEIILVDLAPEELIKRLKEGKVYTEDKSAKALVNFFRPGNLSALRELSLRMVADRVNQELKDYRQIHHITDVWKTRHSLLVAVYASPFSESLIRWTRHMASGLGAVWFGAYVESDRALTEQESTLLSRNLALVEELGGSVLTTVDDDPVTGLIRLARDNQVTQLVVGKSRRGWLYNLTHGGSVVQRLLRDSGNIDVYVVSGEPAEHPVGRQPSVETPPKPLSMDYLVAILAPILIGLIGYLLDPVIAYRAVGLIFLLGVTILGLYINRIAVILSALLCGVIWDYFFIPPHHTFAISSPEDIMMFAMFLVTGMAVGNLTARLRQNQRHLRIRELRVTALYELTRDIASARDINEIFEKAVEHIGAVFDAEVAILSVVPGKTPLPYIGNTLVMDDKELAVAEWSAFHKRPAGLFTDTLPSAKAFYIPLIASRGTVGVLGIRPKSSRLKTPELTNLVEIFAHQLSMAIEHEQIDELARERALVQESEKLYQTMMSSVSHELKTPLAAIEGSASALRDPLIAKDSKSVACLIDEIQEGAKRLSRIVGNLLDMTRLESGRMLLRREPGDVRDLIWTALRHLEKELESHPVSLNIPDESPMVTVDFTLMEQALANILHNAALHTPDGTPIEIDVSFNQSQLVIRIRDHGPGLPKDNPEQVLEKFWRGDPSRPGGTGLGLAIAKGWVEANGGTLHARNNADGGAEFEISLSLENVNER